MSIFFQDESDKKFKTDWAQKKVMLPLLVTYSMVQGLSLKGNKHPAGYEIPCFHRI
jgi:hypothetical protein